jgi:hypothetical protein
VRVCGARSRTGPRRRSRGAGGVGGLGLSRGEADDRLGRTRSPHARSVPGRRRRSKAPLSRGRRRRDARPLDGLDGGLRGVRGEPEDRLRDRFRRRASRRRGSRRRRSYRGWRSRRNAPSRSLGRSGFFLRCDGPTEGFGCRFRQTEDRLRRRPIRGRACGRRRLLPTRCVRGSGLAQQRSRQSPPWPADRGFLLGRSGRILLSRCRSSARGTRDAGIRRVVGERMAALDANARGH